MAWDYDPSMAEYRYEIPTESIESIKFVNDSVPYGTRMHLTIKGEHVLKHSGFLREEDVKKDYVSRAVLLSILEARAKDHERMMNQRGVAGLYSAAVLHQHHRCLILEMIDEIRSEGMINRDA